MAQPSEPNHNPYYEDIDCYANFVGWGMMYYLDVGKSKTLAKESTKLPVWVK